MYEKKKQNISKDYQQLQDDILDTCRITGLSITQVEDYLKVGVVHSQLCTGVWHHGKFTPADFHDTMNKKRLQRTRKILH